MTFLFFAVLAALGMIMGLSPLSSIVYTLALRGGIQLFFDIRKGIEAAKAAKAAKAAEAAQAAEQAAAAEEQRIAAAVAAALAAQAATPAPAPTPTQTPTQTPAPTQTPTQTQTQIDAIVATKSAKQNQVFQNLVTMKKASGSSELEAQSETLAFLGWS